MRETVEAAELGGVPGRGYLSAVDRGYRRVEGIFLAPTATRDRIAELMVSNRPVEFTGVVYVDGEERTETTRVYLNSFREAGGRMRVEITRVGNTPGRT